VLNVEAVANDTANAQVQSVAGGLFGAGINIADASVDPTVEAWIDSPGLVSTSSNIEVKATSRPEADAVSKGTAVGGLAIGGSDAQSKVDPDVKAYIVAPAVRTAGTGNITVLASATPQLVNPPSYKVVSTDQGADTLHIDDHGLSTGDVVAYENNGQTAIGGLEGAVLSGLPAPNDKFYREYNVIAAGEDDLSFGAIFDGDANVDPVTDIITFDSPHNLETGDRVFYLPGIDAQGVTSSAQGGLTANTLYYVLALDGERIKLTTYDPLAVVVMQPFTPNGGSDTITVNGHGWPRERR